MFDERRLYMKQLLKNCKQTTLHIPTSFTIKLTHSDGKDEHRIVTHNEGIDMAIEYIDELERKVDELQYIEKIIKAAKGN